MAAGSSTVGRTRRDRPAHRRLAGRLLLLGVVGLLVLIPSGAAPVAAGRSPQIGVVSGSAVLQDTTATRMLGAGLVRVEFDIGSSVDELRPVVAAHAANGTRLLPLAGFHGSMPSAEQARNLASWARAFGPEGSFWNGRSDGQLAIREIEFGNETSYGAQYGDNWNTPSYYARAQMYARRFKEAQEAIAAAGARVGLLAQADDANTKSPRWVEGMFAAVPDLGRRVAGWTVHPYGPSDEGRSRLQRLEDQTAMEGASDGIPIFVTELGIASDDGACLDDNYGWSKCLSYADSAVNLRDSVAGIRAQLGPRLQAIFVYQARDQRATETSSGREHFFGALRHDLGEKGAFTRAVRDLLSASPPSAMPR